MKIDSFQDLYAVVSKFKPKSKHGEKTKDITRKKASNVGKKETESSENISKNKDSELFSETQSPESSKSSIKIENKYWIRGHNGPMIQDFLSAFCSAHEIDLFLINPEFIYENWSNILALLPNELDNLLRHPNNEKEIKENQKEENQEKKTEIEANKEKEKTKNTSKESVSEDIKENVKNNNAKVKLEKVFDMENLIKEPENEEKEPNKNEQEEKSQIEQKVNIDKELEKNKTDEVPLKEYRILYFDFNVLMDYFSQNKVYENIEYIKMKKFLQSLLSILDNSEFSEKTLLLVNNDGNYYANLFNELFNFELTVPLPGESDRKQIFDVLKESNLKIAYESTILASATYLWSLWDIKKLVDNAIHRFSLGLCRYDAINSDFMLSLMNTEKVLPKKSIKLSGIKIGDRNIESKEINLNASSDSSSYLEIKSSISDSLIDQLYQEAAYKEFDNLSRIIQDMIANKPLIPDDYKLIANYAFILNDDPKKALTKLNQAKTRVDRIKKLKDK